MLNFREYMNTIEEQTGRSPALELDLPSVTRRGRILGIKYRQGGVAEVTLGDSTVVRLTTGQMGLVEGGPVKPGRVMTVTFQGREGHVGDMQIVAIRCDS